MTIDDLLDRATAEAMRRRGLVLLAAIRSARTRIDDAGDGEAVHDFRVGLRRLRSLLKAHRGDLGRKLDRCRRRLSKIAEATGQARDAEVQLTWLDGLTGAEGIDLTDLRDQLRARKDSGYMAIREEALPSFDRLAHRLHRSLARCRLELDHGGAEIPYGTRLAGLLRAHSGALAAALTAIHAAEDEERVHAARIEGKRLRYLLEPLGESATLGELAGGLVKCLRGLQDTLGDLHDLHVLGHVAAGTPAALPVRERRDQIFAEVSSQLAEAPTWLSAVDVLAERLAPAEIEIERKYLLGALPELPSGGDVIEMEQGYLPGERLHERLRLSRFADGTLTRVRAMKLGAGVRRIEVEEDCPAELFDRMWPLTAGKRVKKRRHRVKVGDLTWEIDQFLDRDLVVAEVEIPSEETEVILPDWLAAVVVRDVTGERALTNQALAR